MSPEQCRGEELTEASDIYSLGIVVFEMLTGKVPYDAPTPIGIVHKQITEPVPKVGKLEMDVPGATQDVMDKALAKSPDGRFSSGEELAEALRTALCALRTISNSPRGILLKKLSMLVRISSFEPKESIENVYDRQP